MTKPAREHIDGYRCGDCERIFTSDDSDSPLYECGSCGDTYSRNDSADGGSNRCPSCNKFGAKVSDVSCPDGCTSEPEEWSGDVCVECDAPADECECGVEV